MSETCLQSDSKLPLVETNEGFFPILFNLVEIVSSFVNRTSVKPLCDNTCREIILKQCGFIAKCGCRDMHGFFNGDFVIFKTVFFFQDPIKTFKVYSTIVHDVCCHHANWSPKYYISLRDVFTHQYRLFFGNIPSNFSHQKLYLQFGTMSIKISSFLKRYPPVEGHP